MHSPLLLLCGFGIVGLFAMIHAAYTAPEGVEDESGFHFLDQSDSERYQSSLPPSLSEGDVLFFK